MPERHQTDSPIPLSRLGDLAGWYLNVRCERCKRRVMTKVLDLAARYGGDLPVWRLVERLRCMSTSRRGRRCGGKPGYVTLVQGQEGRKDFQVLREIVVRDDRMRISD